MGCSDISLNRWVVARETLSTATYNKIQYKVWGIIQLRRGWGAAGQAQAEEWERCGNIQCLNRNSWEQEPQKDVLTVQCLEGKGGKDIPDVCKKKKKFLLFSSKHIKERGIWTETQTAYSLWYYYWAVRSGISVLSNLKSNMTQ